MENQTLLTKKERRELKRENKEAERIYQTRVKKIKKYITRSFVVLIIIVAIVGIWRLSQQSATSSVSPNDVLQVQSSDWIKGNANSIVTLIEYSDFQCPACASYYPLLKKLTSEFSNDITFVYRHFPLRQIHPNAQLAGQAAEAGGKQDRFWEMHDMIFEGQKNWSNQSLNLAEDIFVSYAEQLDIDIEKFKIDINSKEVKDKVNSDYRSGIRSGTNSTPTFFLNGEKIQNPRGYEAFKSLLNNALTQ